MVIMASTKYKVIGYLLLVIGSVLVLLSPLEIYCYYLFSEGGRFHYEGFRFGSFMFGNITCQIVSYFLVGSVFLCLGYGHIRRMSWARKLTIAVAYIWLIIGIPVIMLILFMLAASKNPSALLFYAAATVFALSYIFIPIIIIRHYGKARTIEIFAMSLKCSWIDDLPVNIIITVLILLILIAMSFLLMFFNGIVPFFGTFKTGIMGLLLLNANNLFLGFLVLGTIHRSRLAWWFSIGYFCGLGISLAITFLGSTYELILVTLAFPQKEIDWLKGIPLRNYHFVILLLPPVLFALINDVISKKDFDSISLRVNEKGL
jgi:hypothetical protein